VSIFSGVSSSLPTATIAARRRGVTPATRTG
jgi:hypothetical protein